MDNRGSSSLIILTMHVCRDILFPNRFDYIHIWERTLDKYYYCGYLCRDWFFNELKPQPRFGWVWPSLFSLAYTTEVTPGNTRAGNCWLATGTTGNHQQPTHWERTACQRSGVEDRLIWPENTIDDLLVSGRRRRGVTEREAAQAGSDSTRITASQWFACDFELWTAESGTLFSRTQNSMCSTIRGFRKTPLTSYCAHQIVPITKIYSLFFLKKKQLNPPQSHWT